MPGDLNSNLPPFAGRAGVVVNHQRACPGYTLVWSRDGTAARLLDLAGTEVHRWEHVTDAPWHHCALLDDGRLLVIPCSGPRMNLIELDWNGALVKRYDVPAHHDVRRLPNGNTIALCLSRAHYPAVCAKPLDYDHILELGPDGKPVWEWHYALHEQEIAALVEIPKAGRARDWPHLNTVEVLGDNAAGRVDRRFRAGNILTSGRHIHTILVIDHETGAVVWAWGPGRILGQHEPTMLANGHILLFDNGWGGPGRGYSRVIELDPLRDEIVWQYQAPRPEDFWSPIGSGNQRLPNGNTLICAMNYGQRGRVFEVTPEQEVVWEYWNTDPSPLYRARRYEPALVEPLLARIAPDGRP